MAPIPWSFLTWIPFLCLILSGCMFSDATSRRPMPPALAETARIAGYEGIRYWGDETSQVLKDNVRLIDEQVFAAGRAGRSVDLLERVAFLAISGGGDEGAFTAGLLNGWSDRGDRPTFEIVTGVSAGALGAPLAFLGASYDRALKDIYTKLSAGDLYESRGIVGYFLDAFDDTTPMRRTLERYVDDRLLDAIAKAYHDGRRILILTTNLDAERPVIWDLSAVAASGRADRREIFIKVLLASSALPGLFPPVYFDVVGEDGKSYQEMHVDGGVSSELVFSPPRFDLIDIERSIFGKVRTRDLYVIRNGKLNPVPGAARPRATAIAERALATLVKNQVVADLVRLQEFAAANSTNFHFSYVPKTFDVEDNFTFDPAYSSRLYNEGLKVGQHGSWQTKSPFSPETALP